MSISINWQTKVISVPQADLTFISGSQYELNIDWLRLQLKDIEDSETGSIFPDTHRHNTQVTLSGVTYARTVEIINGYTVEFENGMYSVACVGANHNIADVKVVNSVSLIIGNSAGLIAVGGADPWATAIEGSYTASDILKIIAAALAGKATGGGTPNITLRNISDTSDTIAMTVDVNGNRSVVNLTP